MIIYNEKDLEQAIRQKENTLTIEDETIGNAFIVAGRIQEGRFPAMMIERIKRDGTCRMTAGEGVVIAVTKGLASTISELLEWLDDEGIEIDVEEVAGRKINLYYGA